MEGKATYEQYLETQNNQPTQIADKSLATVVLVIALIVILW